MAEKKIYEQPKFEVVEPDEGNGANTRLPYGIAKGLGLSTDGMTPRQVWEMLKKRGVNPENEYEKLKEKATEEIKEDSFEEIDSLYPERQREKIYKFREQHQKKTHEFATVIDENGDTFIYKEGETGSVSFRPSEYNNFKGKSLSHNHPQGNTFLSDADIEMLAYRGLRTIEAIGFDGWVHTVEVLPKENSEMSFGTEKRLLDFYSGYQVALKKGLLKAHKEWISQPKTSIKTGKYTMQVPESWSLYRKGASPRDGMNWNEYAKIVQNEIMEFSKTTKEKYGVISKFRKES